MDIALLLFLILLNGVLAMSEIAVVSSRKARLQTGAPGKTIGLVALGIVAHVAAPHQQGATVPADA